MSRTVSARIPTDLHEELRERCNFIGESINDFVKACIEIGLHSTCDFDFGIPEEEDSREEKSKSIHNNKISEPVKGNIIKIKL